MACKHAREKLQPGSLKWKHLYFANKTSCKSDTCIRGGAFCRDAEMLISSRRIHDALSRAAASGKFLAEITNLRGKFHQGCFLRCYLSVGVFLQRGKKCFNCLPPKRSAFKETPRAHEALAHKTAELARCRVFLLFFFLSFLPLL